MKDHYGFDVVALDDLTNITNGNNHYVYGGVDFLYKNNGNKHLLVTFHGAAKLSVKLPIFRCYNRTYNNSDVLCISDIVLDKYRSKQLELAWFLSTEKHNAGIIYEKIFNHIINKYTKVLFFGTSGGGFPALYYACKYNAICLLGNSQIYPDKYKYYPTLTKILQENNDKLIVHHIEDIMITNLPKQIILSTNTNDAVHYQDHTLPFIEFCKKINFNNITLLSFDGHHVDAHSHYFQDKVGRTINRILK